jgi:hypothetical protein
MKFIEQIRYSTCLSTLTFLVLTAFIMSACTGAPKTVPIDQNKAVDSMESADPLGQLLHQAQSDQKKVERSDPNYPQGIMAVSTFAMFSSTRLIPHHEKYQQAFYDQIQKKMVSLKIPKVVRQKIQERFSLVTVPINEDLPINISVFTQMNHPLTAVIKQAKDIMFIRYRGNALHQAKHLQLLCSGLKSVTAKIQNHTNSLALAHLSTLQLLEAKALTELCGVPLRKWVRPAVELVNAQNVRLISRGLAQFGQSDLESNVMNKSIAPQWIRAFQLDMQSLETSRPLQAGDQWQGHSIKKCQRPTHYYDLHCILIDYSKR